ncbi:penicillin-binding protein [Streptacidiphilus sp. 4-A2]|nr:penicillin-binding protein [Streptacidiphilus sp. 4-A2]
MMQNAIVSIENPTFYSDEGIAPKGILRALISDVQGGEFEGGSTITQQFVKNAYLTDQQTFTRKLVEIFKAVKITRTFPKPEILDDYLNTVYFGRGSYGIEAAAQSYFGVPVDQITDPARAAYLAALVNEPTVLSQTDPTSQGLLKARWALVLKAMVKAGRLTPAQAAATHWPTVQPLSGAVSYDANGVDDSAMAQVADTYLDKLHQQNPDVPDSATANAGGDVIRTTFNRADMTAAVRAVKAGLYAKLNGKDKSQATVDQGVQVGLASVDTRTGELLAIYPGGSEYDNATLAQIEPGSQMGAFALAATFGAPSDQQNPSDSVAPRGCGR